MKWTPCQKTKCKYFVEADAELVVEYKHHRVRMSFTTSSDHPGHAIVSASAWVPYPCAVCKFYEPRKLDLYVGPQEETK